MAKLYYDSDANLEFLKNKKIGILGYGSQGHAHALNLKDSGLDVLVGLHSGSKSKEKAEAEGLRVYNSAEITKACDIIMMLVPDMTQRKLYIESVAPNLTEGKTIMFAHGFSIHYKQINPPDYVDVSMIAPKAPGHRVRQLYQRQLGVPALLAIEQDHSGNAHNIALAYGKGIGSTRAGILLTTFKEETETDLFGEQSVLCGGVTSLIKAGFETLVEAGYQPESAYFECMHELKLIVDLLYQGGMEYMRYSISETAEYGDYTRGPKIIGPEVKERMKEVLTSIQNGEFAREWIAENDEGRKRFEAARVEEAEHPIEKIGKELRSMMPWLQDTV